MAILPTVQNRVRVAGAGFTIFAFAGQPITFCEQVAHTSPRAVADPSPIQPMDEPYPVEILVSPAAGPGQLVLNLFELFGTGTASKVWDRLGAGVGGSKIVAGLNSGPNLFGSAGPGNESIFTQLQYSNAPFAGAVDIVDIAIRQSLLTPDQMQIIKIVRPLSAGNNATPYTEEYNGCVITDVVDGETVAVGTQAVLKQITVAYRYITRDGNPSQGFAQRNGQQANVTPQLQ